MHGCKDFSMSHAKTCNSSKGKPGNYSLTSRNIDRLAKSIKVRKSSNSVTVMVLSHLILLWLTFQPMGLEVDLRLLTCFRMLYQPIVRAKND